MAMLNPNAADAVSRVSANSDTKAAIAIPDPRGFLRRNAEQMQQLITFVDFAADKFTLGFVSVNFPDDRATIITALQQHSDCEDIQLVVVAMDDPNLRFLRDELVKKLATLDREPNKKLVVLVTGLEASIGMVEDYPPVLQDLNYVRDGFAASIPHPIVMFLPDHCLSRVAEFAPDVWAWKRVVIQFESVGDRVKSKLHQVIPLHNHPTFSTGKNKEYKTMDSRAKRDLIPRLLMEYQSGTLAQDKEYKQFESYLIAELGISFFDGDDFEKAKDLLIKSLKYEESKLAPLPRYKIYCCLGILEGRNENYEEALDLLNQSIAELESSKDIQDQSDDRDWLKKAFAHRGYTYRLIESYDAAINDFSRAIELDEDYEWAIAYRGSTYRLIKKYPEAISDLTHAVEIKSKDKWNLNERGLTYQAQENYELAINDFSEAIEIDKNYEQAIANRGSAYRYLGEYESAITDLTDSINLNPDAWNFTERGLSYHAKKEYELAIQDFSQAIKIDPKYKWAFFDRGITYDAMGKYNAAINDFDHAIEIDNNYRGMFFQRGCIYLEIQDYNAAADDFSREIEMNNNHKFALYFRGYTYRIMGEFGAAINDFNRVAEIDGNYVWAIAERGYTYQLIEKYDAAINDFNRAIEIDRNYEWAIAERGQTYYLQHQYESALKDFELVFSIDQKRCWYVGKCGEIKLLMRNLSSALSDLTHCLELNTENDWAFYVRSIAHNVLNQSDEMSADIQQAITLAQETYSTSPQDHQNSFNLALYHLAAGNMAQSTQLYQTTVRETPSIRRIKDAIRDLEDLLEILPHYPNAEEMHRYLTVELERRVDKGG